MICLEHLLSHWHVVFCTLLRAQKKRIPGFKLLFNVELFLHVGVSIM